MLPNLACLHTSRVLPNLACLQTSSERPACLHGHVCLCRPLSMLQTEAEAVAAQHELDKQEWQAEMGRQQEAHDKAMGEVQSCRQSAWHAA